MPSAYLTLSDAQQYGLPSVTSGQIASASALIDAYLKRPEGLIWVPDSTGQPAYMAGMSPDYSFTLQSAIQPGNNVAVSLSGPAMMLQVGDILVLDQGSAGLTEACTIATTSGPSGNIAITLQTVTNAHSSGASVLHGLVIEEQKYMPKNRPITMLSRTPVLRVLSGVGRYGYGRRGDGADDYNMQQFNLLAALSKFGGPPYWELFQSAFSQNWDPNTGQLWIPAGVMLAYYSEVKVRYVAGFPAGGLPASVKSACAQIILALQNTPAFGNVKMYKAGDTTIENFSSSVLSDDVKSMLAPYAVRVNL